MRMEAEDGVPIAAVEQATGIARATLRIWERRYGFPQPGRDARGERTYPVDQVQKLRLIADLIVRGHRPGQLAQLPSSQLASLAVPNGPRPAAAGEGVPDAIIAPLRAHDSAAVLRLLEESVRRMGLVEFVSSRMPEMNVKVGQAWASGDLEVYEEHLYTELVQQVVRSHLGRLHAAAPSHGPRVLLATPPQELHGLGLLMAQVLLTTEGCPCTSLGTRVPLAQIATAASVFRADVVGLSFTASMNPAHVLRGLEQLRAELPPQVAIWAGGSSPVLARHRIPGVQAMPHVRDALPAIAHWRQAHPA
jgi:methanogenic corrinoid protein MtbC1